MKQMHIILHKLFLHDGENTLYPRPSMHTVLPSISEIAPYMVKNKEYSLKAPSASYTSFIQPSWLFISACKALASAPAATLSRLEHMVPRVSQRTVNAFSNNVPDLIFHSPNPSLMFIMS